MLFADNVILNGSNAIIYFSRVLVCGWVHLQLIRKDNLLFCSLKADVVVQYNCFAPKGLSIKRGCLISNCLIKQRDHSRYQSNEKIVFIDQILPHIYGQMCI